jgi:hypothetical protein
LSDIATTDPAALPELYRPAVSADLDASDIRLPKLKIGQFMTPQVQEGLVKAGSIFTCATREDAEVLVESGPDGVPVEGGPEFYVLGVRKGWSLTDADDELQTWAFDDPAHPEKANLTYTYTVAVPSVDEQLPFTLLLTRTSTPAARQINLLLKKYESGGDGSQLALLIGSKKRENTEKGFKWYVAQVTTAPEPSDAKSRKAREAAQAVAGNLAALVQSSVAAPSSVADDGQPGI